MEQLDKVQQIEGPEYLDKLEIDPVYANLESSSDIFPKEEDITYLENCSSAASDNLAEESLHRPSDIDLNENYTDDGGMNTLIQANAKKLHEIYKAHIYGLRHVGYDSEEVLDRAEYAIRLYKESFANKNTEEDLEKLETIRGITNTFNVGDYARTDPEVTPFPIHTVKAYLYSLNPRKVKEDFWKLQENPTKKAYKLHKAARETFVSDYKEVVYRVLAVANRIDYTHSKLQEQFTLLNLSLGRLEEQVGMIMVHEAFRNTKT